MLEAVHLLTLGLHGKLTSFYLLLFPNSSLIEHLAQFIKKNSTFLFLYIAILFKCSNHLDSQHIHSRALGVCRLIAAFWTFFKDILPKLFHHVQNIKSDIIFKVYIPSSSLKLTLSSGS